MYAYTNQVDSWLIGEDDTIIQALVDRTGCRVHFGSVAGSYPAQKEVLITGPGDSPTETRREMERLIRRGRANVEEALRVNAQLGSVQGEYEDMKTMAPAQQNQNDLENSRDEIHGREIVEGA